MALLLQAVCHARAALREQPHNGRRQRLRYNAFVRIAGACSVHGDAGERDADAEAAFRAALVSGNAAAWVEAVQAPCHLAPTEACVHVWPAHFQFEGPGCVPSRAVLVCRQGCAGLLTPRASRV